MSILCVMLCNAGVIDTDEKQIGHECVSGKTGKVTACQWKTQENQVSCDECVCAAIADRSRSLYDRECVVVLLTAQ